mgnify:FL=1
MPDIEYTVLHGVSKKLKDMGDGTHAEVIASEGVVGQSIQDRETPQEIAADWGGFASVNTAAGDFVTSVSGVNGQFIMALSGSPLTPGESSVINYAAGVVQPCALEFAGSFVRTGISFATAALFANDPVAGPDPVPQPINILSCYQSSAVQGAAYNAAAGTTMTIVLESALPSVGANAAVFLGDWINVTGLVDNRLCYPNACINYISPDRKTITVGFSDEVALPSLAVPVITPTPGTAKVNFYNNLSGARNAFGIRFTGTIATYAAVVSIFGGDANQVSGGLTGDHRVAIASTAPTYVAGGAWGQYEIKATSRYMLECSPSASVLMDKAEQTNTFWTPHETARTSVKPSGAATLYPRFRLYMPINISRPIAKIVKAEKLTASTTATIYTDAPHGLVTGNYVTLKGIRDIVNFAPINAPVAVTVVDATTFTAVIGTAAIATSYGGMVCIANGGKDQPGIIGQVVQSVQSIVANGETWLQLVGSATWAGLNLGDYVNTHGVCEAVAGADLGIDGAWEVAHLAASTMVVRPIYDIAGARISPNVGALGLTNAGGAVILRPTLRSHDLSVTSWGESRVQIDGQGMVRNDKALPVYAMGGSIGVVQSTAAALSATTGLGGWYMHPAVTGIADVALAALTASANTAAISNALGNGFQVNVNVTAATGTTPTLDFRVEESFDGGTNWVTLYEMQRITAIGNYNTPILRASGRHIRYVQTVGGTTPSFTRSVLRNVLPFLPSEPQKRLMDRTIVPNTLNSVTPILFQGAASNLQLIVNMGAITTTPPAFQIEGSEDGVNWYAVGTPLTAVASSTVEVTVPKSATFARARVSTAGVGATLGYVSLKAWS